MPINEFAKTGDHVIGNLLLCLELCGENTGFVVLTANRRNWSFADGGDVNAEGAARAVRRGREQRTRSSPERRCASAEACSARTDRDGGEREAAARTGIFPRCCAEQLWRALRRDRVVGAGIARRVAHFAVGHA